MSEHRITVKGPLGLVLTLAPKAIPRRGLPWHKDSHRPLERFSAYASSFIPQYKAIPPQRDCSSCLILKPRDLRLQGPYCTPTLQVLQPRVPKGILSIHSCCKLTQDHTGTFHSHENSFFTPCSETSPFVARTSVSSAPSGEKFAVLTQSS